jgi:hypothetical protein
MRKHAAASLCLVLLSQPIAAFACDSPRDVAALKTAALQQRLMVAALTCKSNTDINSLVVAPRAELKRADADLKAYFIAERGSESGEAAYDSYKTKVANLAARRPAIDARAFCAATADEFDALSGSPDGLMQALAAEPLPANVCKAPILAAAPKPAVKLAAAEDVAGVRAAMPAMPYSAAPPPVARMTREEEPIDPADIVPPESYADARDEERRVAAPADDYVPPRLAYAPERRDDRYNDYAPPAPRYAPGSRRGERYWYYRSLYARPRAYDRD